MSRLKKAIIIIYILMILILILLINYLTNNNQEENDIEENEYSEVEDNDGLEQDVNEDSFQLVIDCSEYFGISTIIDNFFENVTILCTGEYEYQGSLAITEEITDEEKQTYIEMILNMLSSSYIEESYITEDNLTEFISSLSEESYNINAMYVSLIDNNISIYMIYGELENSGNEYNFMIAVDSDSSAYEIYLNDYIEEYGYTEDVISNLEIENDNIELNDYNKFTTIDYSEQDMAKKYLADYKKILLNDLEKAYNILDSEYSEEKFDNYEEFAEYYEDRKTSIFSSTLSQYDVTSYDSYTKYTCVDSSGNYYIFYAKGVLNYTIMLDQYTIYEDSLLSAYNSATDEEKVQTNIDKFFKMINTKDYVSAYKLLNDTFKENNFATIDEFKEYAQNNFFENTTITTVNELTESGTYYICTVTTTNTSDTSETMEETFIVSLGEDTDFEMSFTIKE